MANIHFSGSGESNKALQDALELERGDEVVLESLAEGVGREREPRVNDERMDEQLLDRPVPRDHPDRWRRW